MNFKSGFESLSVRHLYVGMSLTIILIMLLTGLAVSIQGKKAFDARLQNFHDLQTDKLIQLRQELNFQAEIILTMVREDPRVNDLITQLGVQQEFNQTSYDKITHQLQNIAFEYQQKASPLAVTSLVFIPTVHDASVSVNDAGYQPDLANKASHSKASYAEAINSGLALKADGLGLKSELTVRTNAKHIGTFVVNIGLQQVGMLRHARSQQSKNKISNLFAQTAILVLNKRLESFEEPISPDWLSGVYWSTLHPNKMLHAWMKSDDYFIDTRSMFELVEYDARFYLLSTLPWQLWQQNENDAISSISVQWQDVTDLVFHYKNERLRSVIILFLATLVLTLLGITVVKVLQQLAQKSVDNKQAELRQSEDNLSILFRLSPLPILLNRFSDGRYVAVNPAMEHLVGYTSEELKQMSFRDLTPEIYAGSDLQRRKTVIESQKYGPYVKQYRHKNGDLIDIEVSGVLFHDHTGEKFIWTIIKDLREIKRIEKLKDDFVSTVSHELRTPLTSISGAIGLVLGGAAGTVEDKAEKLLSIAHKNSQRLNLLINDLLDFDKLMAGKMRFEPALTSVNTLLEDAIEQHQLLARNKGVTLQVQTLPVAMLWVDPDRIAQVLSNYLSNAIKFSPQNTKVTIGADVLNDSLRIWVQDQGPGISADNQSRLFKRFSQLENVNDAKGGTGLGLAISREIAFRSGGDVGVCSSPGEGATFWLQLPLYSAKTNDCAGNKILVVEDDNDTAHMLCEYLKTHHFTAVWAKTIDEAKHKLNCETFCALTLDLKLDGQNGADFFLYLRNSPDTANLPVLVVSAYTKRGKLQLSALAHALDWLEKPIDPGLLILKLNRLLALSANDAGHNRILHVEDDEDITTIIGLELKAAFVYTSVSSIAEAKSQLAKSKFDLVLLDLALPDGNGTELLNDIRLTQGDIPIVIFSARDMPLDQKQQFNAMFNKTKVSTDMLAKNLKSLLKC